jgi:hypothetical protein
MISKASQQSPFQKNSDLSDKVFQEQSTMLKRRAIGTFSNYKVTETALAELKDSGFSMEHVSVVGHDINRHPDLVGAHTSDRIAGVDQLDDNHDKSEEGAGKGAVVGSAVGGLTGLLIGLGAIAIPGVGPVMLAGAAATAIVTAMSGTAIGAAAGSLAGGLMGLGISSDRAKVYSDRVAQGEYLVMVDGLEADIALAELIFTKHGITNWHIDDLPVESPPLVPPYPMT